MWYLAAHILYTLYDKAHTLDGVHTSASDALRRTVRGVQQDGGLADDPALVAVEADPAEAVVEALVLGRRHVARRPRLAAVERLQQRLPAAQQEACSRTRMRR